jgi:cytochrome c oxidase subunit 4
MKTKIPPRNILIGVWFVLMIFMLINFALSHFNVGAVGTSIELTLAFVQMILVILFFMRLRQSSKIVRIAAATGYFWLLILFVLAFADYLTRQWH